MGTPAVPHTVLLCSASGTAMPSAPSGMSLKAVLLGSHRLRSLPPRNCCTAHSSQWATLSCDYTQPGLELGGEPGCPSPSHGRREHLLLALKWHSQARPSTPLVTGPSLDQAVRTRCGLFFRHSPVDGSICCPRFWQQKSGCYQPNHVNCQHFSYLCLYQLWNNGRAAVNFLLSYANYYSAVLFPCFPLPTPRGRTGKENSLPPMTAVITIIITPTMIKNWGFHRKLLSAT